MPMRAGVALLVRMAKRLVGRFISCFHRGVFDFPVSPILFDERDAFQYYFEFLFIYGLRVSRLVTWGLGF